MGGRVLACYAVATRSFESASPFVRYYVRFGCKDTGCCAGLLGGGMEGQVLLARLHFHLAVGYCVNNSFSIRKRLNYCTTHAI